MCPALFLPAGILGYFCRLDTMHFAGVGPLVASKGLAVHSELQVQPTVRAYEGSSSPFSPSEAVETVARPIRAHVSGPAFPEAASKI